MKTFEEAVDMYIVAWKQGDLESQIKAAFIVQDQSEKIAALVDQAKASRQVTAMCLGMLQNFDPVSAVFSGFMVGVQVGMEMEKCSFNSTSL